MKEKRDGSEVSDAGLASYFDPGSSSTRWKQFSRGLSVDFSALGPLRYIAGSDGACVRPRISRTEQSFCVSWLSLRHLKWVKEGVYCGVSVVAYWPKTCSFLFEASA